MHFRGLVFVPLLKQEAVARAMAPFEGHHWDWWRVGGRWDGYLQGEAEMARRATHDGFNFDDTNQDITLNNCRAAMLPKDASAYFILVDGEWIERDDHPTRLPAAIEAHPDWFVVVVDVHN